MYWGVIPCERRYMGLSEKKKNKKHKPQGLNKVTKLAFP